MQSRKRVASAQEKG
jgi:hypothetical protein